MLPWMLRLPSSRFLVVVIDAYATARCLCNGIGA
jgi:hypothetical protein